MAHRPVTVAPEADDDFVGLLTVWNPELKPDTIKAHVDILRQGEYVWWARIQKGKSVQNPNTSVDDYEPFRKLAAQDNLLLFVTDYRSLYVLRVTDVVTTRRLDPADQPFTPAYSRGENALAWFKVTDIRAISQDSLEALDWMKRRIFPTLVGGGKPLRGTWGFDPYASLPYSFPCSANGTGPAGSIASPGRATASSTPTTSTAPPCARPTTSCTATCWAPRAAFTPWCGRRPRSRRFGRDATGQASDANR